MDLFYKRLLISDSNFFDEKKVERIKPAHRVLAAKVSHSFEWHGFLTAREQRAHTPILLLSYLI